MTNKLPWFQDPLKQRVDLYVNGVIFICPFCNGINKYITTEPTECKGCGKDLSLHINYGVLHSNIPQRNEEFENGIEINEPEKQH